MKVSLNWIKQFTSIDLPVDVLVEKIGSQLGAVEEVVDLGRKYMGAHAVKVVSCIKHPNADKLSVCKIDDDGYVSGLDRDKDGLVQVVCGAPNVKAGMTAVWLPPGMTVPATADKDPFVLEAREIRGKISNGMLASPQELALGDSHEGLFVIEDHVQPGMPFDEMYGLDDHIIDIENKMFTHRPDLFGQLGVARELAGINGQPFKSPDWYRENRALDNDGRKNVLKLSVDNKVPDLVPRFCAVALKDIKVGPSPVWLQVRLSSVGIRPINNIVDITNFYMMETAQPLHAYDYDKVRAQTSELRPQSSDSGAQIGIRLSKKGEKIDLLNGKEITLDDAAVVITDGQRPIGLGGVMGGAGTEVDENTKNIILECANFDMNLTRKTAMRYGLFTDAATRFTKNQSPRQNAAVIIKAIEDIKRIAGGRVASALIDEKSSLSREKSVKTSGEFISSRLGLSFTPGEIKKILENVEFNVEQNGDKLTVVAPFWRTDIEIPEDIVEEVGRLSGYDKLPVVLPGRDLAPAAKNQLLEFKNQLRQILAGFGANEVLTYSFVHAGLMEKSNQNPETAYKLSNALSPDLQYYRFNLIPSLLAKVHPNIRAGFDKFALFEIGKGHDQEHKDKDNLPDEFELLSLVFADASKNQRSAPAFYEAKKYLVELAGRLGIELDFKPVEALPAAPLAQAYEAQRAAMVSTADGKFLGIMGEFKESVRRQLKLPARTAGFEIDIQALAAAALSIKPYQPLKRFPELEQDFTLRADAEHPYQKLTDFMIKRLQKLSADKGYEFKLEPMDIFQKEDDKDHKRTSWRIILWHPERTLTTKETNALLDEVAASAKKELKAERI